eukprot:12617283-Alexandrium_andersonii.AAC.1
MAKKRAPKGLPKRTRRSPRPCSRGACWRQELRAARRRRRQRRACRRLAAEVDLRAGAVGQE